MNEAILAPQATIDHRLVLAIVIAMAVHGMVVLGVRLPAQAPVKARFAVMEVVLMPAPVEPSVPSAATNAAGALTATVAPHEPPLLLAPPLERPQGRAATVPRPKPAPIKPAARPAAPRISPPTTAAAPVLVTPPPDEPLLPNAAQLIERSMAIAATGAGLIEEKTVSGQSLAERTHYIKNNTRDFAEITYKEEVRRKLKRFGELYRRHVPSGHLVIDLAIGIDGRVRSVTIAKSSGIAATDAEALRVVELAAPFAPLWPERAKQSDVVHMEQPMGWTDDGGFSHGQ